MSMKQRFYDLQNPREEHLKQQRSFFGIFSLLIIPLYTFLFARKEHLITSNLSHIGNMPGNRFGFVLWGAVCAIFFYMFFSFVCSLLGCENRHMWNMFRGACVLLLLTVLVPFLPEAYPRFASLHNHFAHTATLLTLAATFLLTLQTQKLGRPVFIKAMALWAGSVALCALVLFTTGISGLVEVLFIAAACVQLFFIMHWTMRSGVQEDEKTDELAYAK